MKKLLEQYGFTTETEYYEMCVDSYVNGQKKQAEAQFSELSHIDKKKMHQYVRNALCENYSHSYIDEISEFFFNLL